MLVIRLAPFGGEAEATSDKTKANHHIPSPDMRDGILGVADVVSNDPG